MFLVMSHDLGQNAVLTRAVGVVVHTYTTYIQRDVSVPTIKKPSISLHKWKDSLPTALDFLLSLGSPARLGLLEGLCARWSVAVCILAVLASQADSHISSFDTEIALD